jgi:hypothetical protein
MPRPDTFWATRIGPAGWAAVTQRTGSGFHWSDEEVLVRVQADEDGRYRVVELHLFPTGEPVTAERLRAVRVSAIEQLLNLPEERARIEARQNETGPAKTFEAFLGGFAASFDPPRPRDAAERSSARLTPPSGRGYPDEFYERVAATYRDALRRGGRPVAAVAAEANVPRSTAARWVKEARRRDRLGAAPATGKAGE